MAGMMVCGNGAEPMTYRRSIGGAGSCARYVAGDGVRVAASRGHAAKGLRYAVAGDDAAPSVVRRMSRDDRGVGVRERHVAPLDRHVVTRDRHMVPRDRHMAGRGRRMTGRNRLAAVMLAVALAVVGFAVAFPQVARSDMGDMAVTSYTVRPGDTLWGYASRITPAGGDVSETVDVLMDLNDLDTSAIESGQRLVVPAR